MDKLSDESLLSFFREDEGKVRLFSSIREAVTLFGASTEHMGKSQISFGTRRRFAWVWMPIRTGKSRPEGCVILTLALRRKAESERVVESVQPYPGRWTSHIVIADAKDIDDDILELIGEAYRGSDNFK